MDSREGLTPAAHATAGAFDRAWSAVREDAELERARQRLSIHEIRLIIKHCHAAFAGTAWQPMDTLPEDGGPAKNQDWPGIMVLAITADGRVVQMRPWMLRDTAKARTPQHLQFPAIGWMQVPPVALPPGDTSNG